jgi:hypothetical protein
MNPVEPTEPFSVIMQRSRWNAVIAVLHEKRLGRWLRR